MTLEIKTDIVGLYTRAVILTPLPKVRTWGGWYRHTLASYEGVTIGRIQTSRKGKRTTTLTCDAGNAGVIGSDVRWLVRRALAAGLIR